MPTKHCMVCRKKFYAKPSHIKRGWAKYCSSVCKAKSQMNGIWLKCHQCGKSIYRIPADVRKSHNNRFFCNRTCQAIWRNKHVHIGENHPNWKNGEHQEYRKFLLEAGAKPKCRLCGKVDFRVLIVHHMDYHRTNNTLKNLTWLCQNCHYLVHNYQEKI